MNAQIILRELNDRLEVPVELTLYGRAAIQLGFENPPSDTLLSLDVDAVFWLGQAEELNEQTNFWEAIDQVNQHLGNQGLYISHFFTEDMVILRPCWREQRKPIESAWDKLVLYRLSDVDLLLSKLMRDDPQDQQDAWYIVQSAPLAMADVQKGMRDARVPNVQELAEQYRQACARLLKRFL
jgi:hypothetical protein